MSNKKKYTKDALENGVGTTNGWGYDLFEGGYIDPHEILIDTAKADKLREAIDLLYDWKCEMEEDGILNDY